MALFTVDCATEQIGKNEHKTSENRFFVTTDCVIKRIRKKLTQ